MVTIDVSEAVAVKIKLLAKAWRVSPGVAVQRLVEDFESDLDAVGDDAFSAGGRVNVHSDYQGTRTAGIYDRADRSLLITSGACEGERFSTPSAAAIAVVSKLNPGVNPSRNGWAFWVVDETGQRLQSVRY
jgi:hypothetical protein